MRALLLVAALGAASGCGSSCKQLYGSVSEVYDLSFDSIELDSIGSFLVVNYVSGSGKPAKLTLDTTGITVMPGVQIDLTSTVNGQPRGTLERIESSGTTALVFSRGNVTFDQTPTVGSNLTGSFNTTLVMPQGRTLDGNFCGPLLAPNGVDGGARD